MGSNMWTQGKRRDVIAAQLDQITCLRLGAQDTPPVLCCKGRGVLGVKMQ